MVVGLGNPGLKYANTKHNVGFWAVEALAHRLSTQLNREKWQSLTGETFVGGEKVLLAEPLTFMNHSGHAVRDMLNFYQDLKPETDLIVIYDDMDFPVGDMRLRERGSAGGHNGVKSVIEAVGSTEFCRVRIGIDRPEPQRTVIDHVLSPFTKDAEATMNGVVERAADAVRFALEHSFSLAMNRYNGTVDLP